MVKGSKKCFCNLRNCKTDVQILRFYEKYYRDALKTPVTLSKEGSNFTFNCHRCKEDTFNEVSGCGYSFVVTKSTLDARTVPCRCNPNHIHTTQELEHLINTLMKKGAHFLNWDSSPATRETEFYWKCERGHKAKTKAYRFIQQGTRCSECSRKFKVSWKYHKELAKEIDYFYIVRLENSNDTFFYKIGRTKDPKSRFKEYRTKFDVKVLIVYKGLYEDIWWRERKFHDKYFRFVKDVDTCYSGHSESYGSDILTHSEILNIRGLEDDSTNWK